MPSNNNNTQQSHTIQTSYTTTSPLIFYKYSPSAKNINHDKQNDALSENISQSEEDPVNLPSSSYCLDTRDYLQKLSNKSENIFSNTFDALPITEDEI